MKNHISFVNNNQTNILDLRGNLIVSNNYPFLKRGLIKGFPSLKQSVYKNFKELVPFSHNKYKSSEALVNPLIKKLIL